MNVHEMMKGNAFPDAPLDSKDRQIIQTVYAYRSDGVVFNQLVSADPLPRGARWR